MKTLARLSPLLIIATLVAGCGGGGSDDESPPVDMRNADAPLMAAVNWSVWVELFDRTARIIASPPTAPRVLTNGVYAVDVPCNVFSTDRTCAGSERAGATFAVGTTGVASMPPGAKIALLQNLKATDYRLGATQTTGFVIEALTAVSLRPPYSGKVRVQHQATSAGPVVTSEFSFSNLVATRQAAWITLAGALTVSSTDPTRPYTAHFSNWGVTDAARTVGSSVVVYGPLFAISQAADDNVRYTVTAATSTRVGYQAEALAGVARGSATVTGELVNGTWTYSVH